jgi:hypothetical protein
MSLPPALLGLRYRGQASHVESWFFKASEPGGGRALWVRHTVFAQPGLPPVAEVWGIAFDRQRGHVAVKSSVPFAEARFADEALDVVVDGCSLTLDRTAGVLASGRGSVRWDVAIGSPLAAPIQHLSPLALYRDGVPPLTKIVTPLSDARASGTVRVEREGGTDDVWSIDGWPAMIGHNWGRRHAELYAWTHANAWDVDGLVFEGVSARVRVGPLLSPLLTAAFVRFRGRSWDLRQPRALAQNRGVVSLRRWEMTGRGGGAADVVVRCDVAAETDDMVGLHYPNPDRTMTYCLNSKLARARLELTLPGGEKITAHCPSAALEIGTLDRHHGVRMYL